MSPEELTQRRAVIAEARSWIGTAYHHRQAVKATRDADGSVTSPGGGKGGGSGSFNDTAAVIAGVCEGPVIGFTGVCWANEIASTLSTYNLTAFLGSASQTAWDYFGTAPATTTVDVWSDTRTGTTGPG